MLISGVRKPVPEKTLFTFKASLQVTKEQLRTLTAKLFRMVGFDNLPFSDEVDTNSFPELGMFIRKAT